MTSCFTVEGIYSYDTPLAWTVLPADLHEVGSPSLRPHCTARASLLGEHLGGSIAPGHLPHSSYHTCNHSVSCFRVHRVFCPLDQKLLEGKKQTAWP